MGKKRYDSVMPLSKNWRILSERPFFAFLVDDYLTAGLYQRLTATFAE